MKEKFELQAKMPLENLRNEIVSENKFQRKKALECLQYEIDAANDQRECQKIFNDYQVYILKCFRDESEVCRELAIELMWSLLQRLNLNDYYLTYIFPVLVERIGTQELIEESEELRLKVIEFMIEIIKMYRNTEYLVPFLNDIMDILVYSLADKHPKIKQSCCDCIIELANALPKHFHMQCENLIKPLLKSFTHQHFRVRVSAIRATGIIIMHGSYKALESTATHLAEKLFDQVPQVRQAVVQVSAQLLTDYRDRYSYFHKILPLILTGLTDEVPDTRKIAEDLWLRVGLQYQNENEKDLKDELDYTENINTVTRYPRPNLGCRTLVQRNMTKIVAALCRELTSTWQDDVKVRCGQLLTSLILHAEIKFTQNLQDVFPAMFSVCRNNDDGSQAVTRAAELIGVFIPGATWFKFVAEVFSQTVNCGHLRVLKAIMVGCGSEGLGPVCAQLAGVLSARHVCHVRGDAYLRELLECAVLLGACEHIPRNELSVIALAVLGLTEQRGRAKDAAGLLLDKCWLRAADKVEVCRAILETFTSSAVAWTCVTTDKCILDALLKHSVSIENICTSHLLEIISNFLCSGQDAEAKISTYIIVTNSVEKWNETKCTEMNKFYEQIAKDIILPNLVWGAGRSKEALRAVSMHCLCNILESGPYDWVNDITETFVPLLVSLLEDSCKHTRYFSVRSVCFLVLPDQETLIKVYQLLLSRLDDEYDVARAAAVKALEHVFTNVPDDFERNIFQPHFEHLVDTLLVHLEDEDAELKSELMETLAAVARVNPGHVVSKTSSLEHLFENERLHQQFIQNISALSMQ